MKHFKNINSYKLYKETCLKLVFRFVLMRLSYLGRAGVFYFSSIFHKIKLLSSLAETRVPSSNQSNALTELI